MDGGAKSYLQRLAFKVGDRSVVLKTSEIHWIEAEDYYVLLHTARGRHLVRVSMASLEAELDPAVFVRALRNRLALTWNETLQTTVVLAFVCFATLTLVGVWFRGAGMALVWPWG